MDRLIEWLERKDLNVEAAALLEALSPLAWVGAQVVYFAEPFLGAFGWEPRPVAEAMEDPEEMQKLLLRLREDS